MVSMAVNENDILGLAAGPRLLPGERCFHGPRVICYCAAGPRLSFEGHFKDGDKSSSIWREALIGPAAAKLLCFKNTLRAFR